MKAESTREEIAALLRRTGQAHHEAFAAVDGEDPEWAAWYAEHLVGPLGAALAATLDRSRLAQDLTTAEAERQARAPVAEWSRYYADWLLRCYGD
jgi:hypothetical protein